MIKLVFAIFDSKVGSFNLPFFCQSMGEAERVFTSSVRSSDSALSQFPEDFSLHYIGEYDLSTGVFTNAAKIVNMGLASKFLVQKPEVLDFPTK